jgi:hypothetical protein
MKNADKMRVDENPTLGECYFQHTCQASGASRAQMWRVFYCNDCGGETDVKYTKPALSFEQQAEQLLS